MIQFPRITLYSEPDFDLSSHIIQVDNDCMTMMHLDVFYWSPKVLRRIKSVWQEVRPRLGKIVYCMGNVSDKKFARFVGHLDAKYLGPCLCSDGVNRDIYFHMYYH